MSREVIALTKLEHECTIPGTELFAQYYTVTNMPGVAALWVGKIQSVEPLSYATIEQVWLYEGEEYPSFSAVRQAWREGEMSKRRRDAVAQALLRGTRGLARPFWSHMTDADRESWRKTADHFIRLLSAFGCNLTFQEDDHGTPAA